MKMSPGELTKTYGYDRVDWDRAKEEMRGILGERAREPGRTISYSELAAKVKTIELHHESPALAGMLEQLSREEDAAGRGMLSALVVHKNGPRRPGRGFFSLAQELGRELSDEEALWIQELRKVNESWRE